MQKESYDPTVHYAEPRDRSADKSDTPEARLRRLGFRLVSRPKGSEPVWTRNGVDYTQTQALDFAVRLVKSTERGK